MPAPDQRVDAFRRRLARPPLHPMEKRILMVLSIHLCLLPWMLGTNRPPGQFVSLALAVAAFALAVCPRDYDGILAGEGPAYRVIPWRKLRTFPIFWAGLALLTYVTLQAINPAWRYVLTPKLWWLRYIAHISWLPTGVAAPFAKSNAWRALVIYGAAWLAVCSVWIGLLRRQALRILLLVLAINGLALALVLAIQDVTGDRRIPWPVTTWAPDGFFASFIYTNHAGAYFGLVALCTLALAIWYYDHGRRTLKKSTPGAVLGLAALFLGGAVLFTYSRGASLSLGLAVAAVAAWFFFWRRRQKFGASSPAVSRVIAGAFLLFVLMAFHYLDFSGLYGRVSAMAALRAKNSSIWERLMARSAAEDMLAATWPRGVGAGCFCHLFPEYVKHYPDIYHGGQWFWPHAHDDWLEFPIELGLAGTLILVAGAGWWAWFLYRRRAGWHPLAMPLLIGCGQTLFHAWFDFPFQCPAILTTWCVLVAVAGRWLEAEQAEPPHSRMSPRSDRTALAAAR